MPTYEYKCLDCGQRCEVFHSMTDEPLQTCEACGGRLKRLIGAGAGFIFRGSGFYCTDYRSDSYREAAKKETNSSTTGTGSENKSGTKKETSASTATEGSST